MDDDSSFFLLDAIWDHWLESNVAYWQQTWKFLFSFCFSARLKEELDRNRKKKIPKILESILNECLLRKILQVRFIQKWISFLLKTAKKCILRMPHHLFSIESLALIWVTRFILSIYLSFTLFFFKFHENAISIGRINMCARKTSLVWLGMRAMHLLYLFYHSPMPLPLSLISIYHLVSPITCKQRLLNVANYRSFSYVRVRSSLSYMYRYF